MPTVPNEDTLYSDEDVIPFPGIEDRLFTTERYSQYNAQVNYIDSDDALYRYVLGYKEAGDRLVRSLIENSRHIDLVIFPTVFLYRQYLELRLKQLLIEGGRLLERHFAIPKHHRLDTLWYDCKKLLKQIEPNMPDQEVMALEVCIIGFSTIDLISMAFRYHIDTHDNPSLPSDLKYINIRNLAQIMAKIHSFLDAAYMAITVSLDQKREMEEVLKDYYPSEEDWRDYYSVPDE
jgi:hypothetical protein